MKKRYIYMDILTILSALFVVYLHTTLSVYTFRLDMHWFVGLIIQSLFIWPVPIFLMISGANLLKYRERYDTKTFFAKRFIKVGIPLIVWSIIWLIYKQHFSNMPTVPLKTIIKWFAYNNIQNIFWFFYTIICLYICTPILSIICKKENKRAVLYFIFLCLIQQGIIPMISSLIHYPIPFYNSYTISFSYLSFYLSGWYLNNFSIKKCMRKIIYIMGFFSGIWIYYGTYLISSHNQHFNRVFFYYNSPFVFILSIAVFIFFKRINWEKFISPIYSKLIMMISSTSFGVYIIHEFYIFELDKMLNLDNNSYFFMLIFPFIIYLISVITILLLKKISFIKKVVP
ncbi:acyltransferase family protein [Sporolactobacillus shoreicorticis]|uniref:Acyltransferase n=1 Tax=Sporolactobacillus shoreicorticis TaxID=1923877 RepID=A0ABW5RZE5_9BACL|nr:acyltransferase family protein [Sporolactobacillus shoreicorticis]MCO7128330.1 acyltransferase family protein [Sporolactobacillus shoreicorticis]